MSALSTDVIAIRTVLLWAAGLVAVFVISAYTGMPSRERSVSGCGAVLPFLAAKGLLLLGPFGVAIIIGRETRGLNEAAALASVAAGFLFSYWASLIIAQAVQNLAYYFNGAPVQPIRLWAGSKRRSLKNRKPGRP